MTSALIFGLAAAVAVVAVGYKRYAATSKVRRWFNAEGHHPQRPHKVQHPSQIQAFRLKDRCHCGTTLHHLGEESRSDAGGTRVKVTCECVNCDEPRLLYFDLSEMAH
jgi:hypothetical protein